MYCTILKLTTCFALSNIHIDSGLIHTNESMDEVRSHRVNVDATAHGMYSDYTIPVTYDAAYVDKKTRNPYARLELGYRVEFSSSISMDANYSHTSSIATGKDRGREDFYVGFSWRPFN